MDKPPKKKSALNLMPGIDQPSQVNQEAVRKLSGRKRDSLTVEDFVSGIREGNRTILSKAITLVESSLHAHQDKAQQIIARCLEEKAGKSGQWTVGSGQVVVGSGQTAASIRIGITGVPGVGKSTFIEALGKYLTGQGHKLAVLAIDPSSAISKGSILGDKTRMAELSVDPDAFIRPSPSAGSLGGVARKTRETITLCEAAGFDVIFVETVGVGQSETAVHSMVDFFLLLMLAGAGDELQGIKRGIIEMADALIINKADGDNLPKARAAMVEYSNALHLYPPSPTGWKPVTDICSSKTKEGIENVWKIILRHHALMTEKGYFFRHRREQDLDVFRHAIEESLEKHFYSGKEVKGSVERLEKEILEGKTSPYAAAATLMAGYFSGPKG
jgi:LAO/AO transport system kinase